MLGIQSPPVDILEEHDRYIVFVDLPGVQPQDISIYGDEKSLTLEGYRNIIHTRKFIYIERFSGKFIRKLSFKEFINLNKAKASLENGVLTIEIPKARNEFIIDTAVIKITLRR
ncbi:MAG: Hsp20/alpha crystallin family protein [Aquificae bacterium]|nr:Hsp20/alpha crystallin family protein [Aquificota bacterium]